MQGKQLAIAAGAVAIGIGLAYAGVPVSTLLVIGAVLAMILMHTGGHGGCGGASHSAEHHQSGGTEQSENGYNDTAAR